jgi:DNA-3-methyladenine glycosylase II
MTNSVPHYLHTEDDLAAAIERLAAADARMAKVLAQAGRPTLRRRPDGLAGLAAIICAQQLSTASASAIWGRLQAAFDPFHHEALRRARSDKLARLGLSRPKIKTMKAIAAAIGKGELDLAAVARSKADAAHAALTAVHGIGPWTADIYLLFCLGHADAWPAGDLALQEAARMALGLKKRPTSKDMIALAEPWRPWRGVAAHLLWNYYRVFKRRDPVPIQPTMKNGDKNGRSARRPAARAARTDQKAGRVSARLRRRRK